MFFKSAITSDDSAIVETLNAYLAVMRFTPDGRILDANANMLNALRYGLAELQGQSWRTLVDEKDEAGRRLWHDLAQAVRRSKPSSAAPRPAKQPGCS